MDEVNSGSVAKSMDALDPLRRFLEEFELPTRDGVDQVYLCGNSLGLQPKAAALQVAYVMRKWAREGIAGLRQLLQTDEEAVSYPN
jgi:kynureninase